MPEDATAVIIDGEVDVEELATFAVLYGQGLGATAAGLEGDVIINERLPADMVFAAISVLTCLVGTDMTPDIFRFDASQLVAEYDDLTEEEFQPIVASYTTVFVDSDHHDPVRPLDVVINGSDPTVRFTVAPTLAAEYAAGGLSVESFIEQTAETMVIQ